MRFPRAAAAVFFGLAVFFAAAGAVGAADATGRDWNRLIADELERSLGAYRRIETAEDAEALAARLFAEDPASAVLVVDGGVVVDRRLILSKKGMYHVSFLLGVLREGPLPNFLYQWEWAADGFQSEDRLVREGCAVPESMPTKRVRPRSFAKGAAADPLPRVVMAKRYGYAQCGILAPNCYFHTPYAMGGAPVRSRAIPYESRDPRVFWRGAIDRRACADDAGNFARTEAVALTAARPDLFDARFVRGSRKRGGLGRTFAAGA